VIRGAGSVGLEQRIIDFERKRGHYLCDVVDKDVYTYRLQRPGSHLLTVQQGCSVTGTMTLRRRRCVADQIATFALVRLQEITSREKKAGDRTPLTSNENVCSSNALLNGRKAVDHIRLADAATEIPSKINCRAMATTRNEFTEICL
jgi:hypothetical protein